MRALPAHAAQIVEVAARSAGAGCGGQRAASRGVLPDFRIGIGIVFAVLQGGRHFEHLLYRCIAERAAGQLGNDRAYGLGFFQHAFGHQHFAQQPGNRFGDGHRTVLAARIQAAGVLLIHHDAVMQHHDAVGVVGLQRLRPGHARRAVQGLEGDRIDRAVQPLRQGRGGAGSAGDAYGGHQFAEVADGPAQFREAEIVRVGVADALAFRRWETLHPAENARVGGAGAGGCRCGCGMNRRCGGQAQQEQCAGGDARCGYSAEGEGCVGH
jgi:hypothetical protein